ncbi:hypothetical protein C8J56DRAFT_1037955 [Mycena floridula]|nr:hypothetical protein C8J56DRAFT_1037955 [Mycena floridula]
MVRPRLYNSTKERKEAHNQASIRYYARNHQRISAELQAKRLKEKLRREKEERRRRDKQAKKQSRLRENVPEALVDVKQPSKIDQWMRLAAALPRQIHRAMEPDPDRHMELLFEDLSKPQNDILRIERTLKRLGDLRKKADSFWSPIVALEGTVTSPAFRRYMGFQGLEDIWQVLFFEIIHLFLKRLLQSFQTWQTVIRFPPDNNHDLSQAASASLPPSLDLGTKFTPFPCNCSLTLELRQNSETPPQYSTNWYLASMKYCPSSLTVWHSLLLVTPGACGRRGSSAPTEEAAMCQARQAWLAFERRYAATKASKTDSSAPAPCSWSSGEALGKSFMYSKDLSPWTGPLVYLDHSPSFVALECDNEDSVCDFYAATYIRGILAGSYQQTMEWIYDDFLFRHPQYRLGRLFGIDIMLVSQEMIVRRGQHIDFLADYLWRYCNQGEPGFRAAGLIRFMHQWHLHYPGAFSSWIEGQADISPQEEEAWKLSLRLQHWDWDCPLAFNSSIDSKAGISPQEEEAWNDAHDNELYHRFLQERVDSYIIAKSEGREKLQSFLERTDLHWCLSFDTPSGLGNAEAASHQRWRQQYIREGLETIAQRRLFFRRKAKERNGGRTPSPRKPVKPRPAYKIYTDANPTPSPVRRLRIQAGIRPVPRTPLKASSPSSAPAKPRTPVKASSLSSAPSKRRIALKVASRSPSSSPSMLVATELSSSPLRGYSSSAASPLPSSSPIASPFTSPLASSSAHFNSCSKSTLTLPSFDMSSLPETPTRLPLRLMVKK